MILVLGGTTEAKLIARYLKKKAIPYLITTTTELGKQQLTREGINQILVTKFSYCTFLALLKEHPIKLVLDATHPFAEQISALAQQVARENNLSYLRFERTGPDLNIIKNAIVCSSWEEAIQKASIFRSLLLTIGVKKLSYWVQHPNLQQCKIYARILPTKDSIVSALGSGLLPQQILAIYGPVPPEIDLCIIRTYKIEALVTKESGYYGGLTSKIEATKQAGIPIIVIKRPETPKIPTIRKLHELNAFLEKGVYL